jgi:beta-galactosidase beta subunit
MWGVHNIIHITAHSSTVYPVRTSNKWNGRCETHRTFAQVHFLGTGDAPASYAVRNDDTDGS